MRIAANILMIPVYFIAIALTWLHAVPYWMVAAIVTTEGIKNALEKLDAIL